MSHSTNKAIADEKVPPREKKEHSIHDDETLPQPPLTSAERERSDNWNQATPGQREEDAEAAE